MDSKLVLVKIITLLYCESLSDKVQQRSTSLCHDIIGRMKISESVTDTDDGRTTLLALRDTANWMIQQPSDYKYDYGSLAQRLRLNAGEDYSIVQAFEEVERYSEMDSDQMLVVCASIEGELKSVLYNWAIRDVIQKAHRDLFYTNKALNMTKFISDLVADLEVYANGWTKEQQTYVLELMQMSDVHSLKKVLEKAKKDNEGLTGFKTGWQAFNRMLGESESLRPGMFVLVGALTHNYKSGLCHDLFRHFCIYNKPVQRNPDKKPMLLYFSSENRAEEDLMRMYVTLKQNETGEIVDESQIDLDHAAEYVSKRLSENGWEVAMLRIRPEEFTYSNLLDTVIKYEQNGYEIHAIVFDYLNLINKAGISSSMIGEDTRMLMQVVRTFMSSRNILFVTPHQLSQEAMGIKRGGVGNFLKEIAGKNYWDSSKRIANEVDLEVFIDIIERNHKAYLGVHRGKHRTIKSTPSKYRSFYLPMGDDENWVGLIDDVNGDDLSLSSLIQAEVTTDLNFDE